MRSMRGLRLLAYASAASTYALILVGGYVSAIGAGLACPDWPLCHGQILPPQTLPALAEYIHRLIALITSLLIVTTTGLVVLRHRSSGRVLVSSLLSSILLIVQVFMGLVAITTNLDPLITTTHLGLATALFGATTVTALLTRKL